MLKRQTNEMRARVYTHLQLSSEHNVDNYLSTKPLYLSADLWIWSTENFIGFLVKCEPRLDGRTANSMWIQCMRKRMVLCFVPNADRISPSCRTYYSQVTCDGFISLSMLCSIAYGLRSLALAVICSGKIVDKFAFAQFQWDEDVGKRGKEWLTVRRISINTALDRFIFRSHGVRTQTDAPRCGFSSNIWFPLIQIHCTQRILARPGPARHCIWVDTIKWESN